MKRVGHHNVRADTHGLLRHFRMTKGANARRPLLQRGMMNCDGAVRFGTTV